jgi:ATP-binding cassette subfamily B protein
MVKRGIITIYKIEKNYLFYLILTAIVAPLSPYITIYIMAQIVNEFAGERNPEKFIFLAGSALLLNLILFLFLSGLKHLKNYHQNQFFKNERMYFSQKIMDMDYENIENRDIYYLHEKIKIESQTGHNMFYLYNFTGEAISNAVNIIVSLIFVAPLFVDSDAQLLTKFGLILLITAAVLVNQYSTKKSNAINITMYEEFVPHNAVFNFYSDYFSDYNAGKDVRLYAMESILEEEQRAQNSISNSILIKARKEMLKYVLFSSITKDLLLIAVYLFVLSMCLNGSLLLGDIAKYAACITMFIGSFTGLITNIQTLFENNKYLETYFKFLDIPSKETGKKTLTPDLSKVHEFRLENVSFKYPGSETYVLKNITVTIKSGNRTALVGENGSGKTTLIKLLCRLYDAEQGDIYLDNIDIKEYNKASYMKFLNVVFQDLTLFSFSLGQNIAAAEQYLEDKVIDAIEKAGFSSNLAKMKNGLATILYKDFDDEGIEISGGEAQKIALARALYKNQKIFFLDEPTAALDPIAESEIYERINQFAENATTVFVSHRLSSCKFCDEIIVLHKGEMVQKGAHNELLMEPLGKYYELWNAQAQFYR